MQQRNLNYPKTKCDFEFQEERINRSIIMRKYIKLLIIVFVLVLLSVYLFVACSRHGAKNYVYARNSSAEQVYKFLNSESSLFDNYLEDYNIPKSGTVCLSGSITKNMDYYIDNNEYSSDRICLSQNPSIENEVNLYWTVKIVDSQINEVWVYTIPLEQSQLKRYTFQEQVNMVPLFSDDKFEYKSAYVIGYYTAS